MAGNTLSSFIRLPEKKQLIVDSGIPLFELRKIGLNYQGTKDFGYWDITVNEDVLSNRFQYRKKWHHGPTAYITYVPNPKGVCFAFCPDDEFWHNRIQLACTISTNRYIIERYHTREGVISGGQMTNEISLIGEMVHDYKIIVDNKIVTREKNRKKSEIIANEYRDKGLNVQVVFSKIEEIETLIQRYSSKWFMSPEFQHKIRSQIQEKIIDLNATAKPDPVAVGQTLIAQLAALPPSELAVVRKMLLGNAEAEYKLDPGKTEGQELTELTVEQLRRLAKKYGVPAEVIKKGKKTQLITAIQDAIREAEELKQQKDLDNEADSAPVGDDDESEDPAKTELEEQELFK